MSYLEKLRHLPEKKKKIILWSIVVIVGFVFLFLWIKDVEKKIKRFPKDKVFNEIKEEIKQLETTPK